MNISKKFNKGKLRKISLPVVSEKEKIKNEISAWEGFAKRFDNEAQRKRRKGLRIRGASIDISGARAIYLEDFCGRIFKIKI